MVDADLLLIPRTTVGRWMAAAMLGERQLAGEHRRRLNRGLPGWNDDEPGVMHAACEIAMRRCFRPGYDVRDVAGFTKWICEHGGNGLPGRRIQVEAVIRSALGETNIDLTGISAAAKYSMDGAAVRGAMDRLGLDDRGLIYLIVAAEWRASLAGWNPPLADRDA